MSMSASEEKCDTEKIVPRADQADLRFSAARACKTNRVRQESGPDGGGPASGPSGGETGIEMPEMTPGRKDLGALLQGFG
jgi:hypothetical protein